VYVVAVLLRGAVLQGLMDSARRVNGCLSTQQTRVHNAFDDAELTVSARRVIGFQYQLNRRGFQMRV
jgi:hypothetical protein